MSDQFGNISIFPDQSEKPPITGSSQRPPRRSVKKTRSGQKRSPGKKSTATPRGKGWVFRYLAPCLVITPLLYALAGFWLLPAYMKKSLPESINEKTGMHLFIADLDFNPFTFIFTLQDVQLQPSRPTGGDRELLRIKRAVAELAPFQLLRNDLVSNAVNIEGLVLNIIRSHDNTYNVKDLFAPSQQGKTSDIISFSELPFLFSLNNISIRGGRITFQDIPSATTHTLDQIELDLPSLSNFPFEVNQYIHPRFSAIFNGSKIELTGQAAIAAGSDDNAGETKLSCNIQDLDLPLYFNYLPAPPPFSLSKGKAAGTLEISFSRGTKEKEASFSLDFVGRVTEIGVVGRDNTFEATIPQALLEGSLAPLDRQLRIRKLAITKPLLKSRSSNIAGLLAPLLPQSNNSPSTGKPPESAGTVDIDQLEIADGTVELVAAGNSKPQAWTSLQANIKKYSWSSSAQQTDRGGGSFHFSAENADPGTIFDWQGDISSRMVLSGPVRIDNIPASTVLATLGLDPLSVGSGSANLLGKLLIAGTTTEAATPVIDLSETEVTFQDLKLVSGKFQWLGAPSLKLTGLSTNTNRAHLGTLRVDNGAVTISTDRLPEPFSAVANKDGRFTLDAIDFNGSITVSRKNTAPIKLTSVLLQATSLNREKNTGDTVLFSAKVNDKGAVKAKGTARLTPFDASLNTGFSGVDASALLPWFSSQPVIAGAQATMSGKGILSLPRTSYSGELHLDGAVFKSAGKDLLRWKGCKIGGLSYVQSPFHFDIDQMVIDTPEMTWIRTSGEKHPALQFGALLQSLQAKEKNRQNKDDKQRDTPAYSIKTISIADGEMVYRDNRHTPPWSAAISAINGTISDIHSQSAAPSRFSLTGNISQAPFTLTGTAVLLGSTPSGEISLEVSGLPMSAFGTYLPSDLGIDSRQGSFTAATSASWKDSRLSEKTRFAFSKLQAISPEADAALPLALLKNSEGKVVLEVKNERDLAADSIPMLQHTLTTFQRQVVKAKVSPILLTGGDFTDLVGNEFLEFQPAEFALTENGRTILSRFAVFLKAHPHIGLRITGAADRGIDGDAVNVQLEQMEAKRVAEENARRRTIWQKERDLELEQRRSKIDISQGFIEEDLMADFPDFIPLKPAPVAFQEPMLEDLARKRATLVQRLLVEQFTLDPTRISISKELRITGDANMPGNRVLLELRAWNPPEEAAAAQQERQEQ